MTVTPALGPFTCDVTLNVVRPAAFHREARDGIGSWMNFYNHCRPHQAMNNQFPMAAWRAGMADPLEALRYE